MKRVNFKLVAIFLVAAALLAGGVHWLHARQLRRGVADLRRAAGRAAEQRRYADAAKLLKEYLALAPNDTLALEHMADALDQSGTPQATREAVSVIEQVLRRTPERHDLRRRLVRSAMKFGLTQLATGHLKALRDAEPTSGDVHEMLGECLDADGHYADAAHCFETAARLMPEQLRIYAKLADLYRRRLNQPKLGYDWINRMVAQNGDSFQARLFRSRYRRSLGLLAEAADDLARAAALAPDEPDVLLATAELDESAGRLDEARERLVRGITQHADDARLYQSLSRVALRGNERDAALDALRVGLNAVPDHPDLLWALAEMLIESRELAKAREIITRLKLLLPPDAPIGLLDAAILMHEARWVDAREALEHVLPQLQHLDELAKQAQLYLGRCHEKLQDAPHQLAALRRAVELDPAWVPARWELALSLVDLGRPADAIIELRQVLTEPNRPAAAWPVFAHLLFAQAVRTPTRERDWAEFDRALTSIEQTEPESPALSILRAAGLAARGHAAEACDFLRATLEGKPNHQAAWLMYAQLLALTGRADDAAAALGAAESQAGSASALPALARAYERLGRLEQAEAKFHAALAERPHDPQIVWAVADFCLRHARTAEAERYLRAIIDARSSVPKELVAWARRGLAVVLATRNGDGEFAEAMRLIEQNIAAGISPNDDCRAKAVVLATRPEAAARREAMRLLEGAAERWTPRPDEHFLLVQLCDSQGNWSRARKHMLDLIVGPNANATYLVYFIEHLIRHGETDEARLWVERLKPLATPDRTRLVVQLADELARQGHAEDAAGLYRRVLELDARNVVALNNLAWLVSRGLGHPADALPLVDRAIEVAGPRPELRDTRAMVYMAAGRWDDAVRELESAIAESPSSTKYFHLARARLQGRDVAAARAALRQAHSNGLSKDTLHPTEQLDYDKLVSEIARSGSD